MILLTKRWAVLKLILQKHYDYKNRLTIKGRNLL